MSDVVSVNYLEMLKLTNKEQTILYFLAKRSSNNIVLIDKEMRYAIVDEYKLKSLQPVFNYIHKLRQKRALLKISGNKYLINEDYIVTK